MTTPIVVTQMDRARDILSNHRRHLGVIRKEDALAAMLAYAQERVDAALTGAVEAVRATYFINMREKDEALAALEALRSQP